MSSGVSGSTRCPGCYKDPAHGHMFDCPTRIADLEAEVARLREERDQLAHVVFSNADIIREGTTYWTEGFYREVVVPVIERCAEDHDG